jgi:hypothetical protein
MRDVPYIEISIKKEPRRVFRVVTGLTTFDYPGRLRRHGRLGVGWLVGWLVSQLASVSRERKRERPQKANVENPSGAGSRLSCKSD